jgi:hypothetical protein
MVVRPFARLGSVTTSRLIAYLYCRWPRRLESAEKATTSGKRDTISHVSDLKLAVSATETVCTMQVARRLQSYTAQLATLLTTQQSVFSTTLGWRSQRNFGDWYAQEVWRSVEGSIAFTSSRRCCRLSRANGSFVQISKPMNVV